MIANIQTAQGKPAERDRLVAKRAVAGFLGVTCKTIEKLQHQGLPFYRLTSRRNGYFLEEVTEWLKRDRRGV